MDTVILKSSDLARYIDHTNLNLNATEDDLKRLSEEAMKYHFFSVCVRHNAVEIAKHALGNSLVKVCAVVGFPKDTAKPGNCHFGSMPTADKLIEAGEAIEDGADEIDMVINLDALRSCDYELAKKDIASVKKVAGKRVLKVIIESRVLNKEQLVKACQLAQQAGADFVKTSTGYVKDEQGNTLGATVEDVKCMRSIVGGNVGVKASGGIGDYEKAKAMIEAGANRLGCSASVSIVRGD